MMVIDAFRSEWVKLRRPSLLYGTYAALTGAAALFTVLIFARASNGTDPGNIFNLHRLAQPNGLVHGLSRAAMLLGIVAFGIAASQVAMEYSLGTLRQILVRQPRRTVLLGGKYLAVISFLLGAVVFAAVGASIAAVAMAHVRGIPTSAWTSSTGIADMTRALGDIALAVIGYATIGMVVGLFLRSSVAAVVVGFAYLLAVENILAVVISGSEHWLPGQLLTAVAQGGSDHVRYATALLGGGIYLVLFAVAGAVAFARRDVTA